MRGDQRVVPRAFKRDIDIVIGFTKKIDTLGYCQKIDEETIGVLINTDQEPDAIASTIAHELVHAKAVYSW